jgi:hypothetical protein
VASTPRAPVRRGVPDSVDDAVALLHAAFRDLAGVDLAGDPASSVYRQQYAHGGMSSGMIDLDTWRTELMPLLEARASALPRRPIG